MIPFQVGRTNVCVRETRVEKRERVSLGILDALGSRRLGSSHNVSTK